MGTEAVCFCCWEYRGEEKEDTDTEIAAFGNRVNGDCGKDRRLSNSDHCFDAIVRK